MKKKYIATLGRTDSDYQRFGIERNNIALWEDGVRTTGKFGEYEWWYFDSKLDDGSSLVIIFYTAPVTACSLGFAPTVSFSYTTKDGEFITESKNFKKKDARYSNERCDVQIGANTVSGDLNTYKLHYQSERIQADLTLENNTKSWRPEMGHIAFSKGKYFAWLPSVPEGKMKADLVIDGKEYHLTGTGYHDHNWGNIGMFWLMHHWYWGRAKIGDYQVITSYITANEKHGYEHFPIFWIAKDGVKLADDGYKVNYSQLDEAFDPITGKHYHKKLIYDYKDENCRYRITYQMQDILEYFNLERADENAAAKCPKALVWLVKSVGLAPSYIRMVGEATLEKMDGNTVVEKVSAPAIWEQMYFGKDADV